MTNIFGIKRHFPSFYLVVSQNSLIFASGKGKSISSTPHYRIVNKNKNLCNVLTYSILHLSVRNLFFTLNRNFLSYGSYKNIN